MVILGPTCASRCSIHSSHFPPTPERQWSRNLPPSFLHQGQSRRSGFWWSVARGEEEEEAESRGRECWLKTGERQGSGWWEGVLVSHVPMNGGCSCHCGHLHCQLCLVSCLDGAPPRGQASVPQGGRTGEKRADVLGSQSRF